MKVVLFCGGFGTRLREHSDTIPKPLVNIGNRPLLWHLMRYYAHFGHRDFILCLGYRGDMIREYFLGYNEAMSNDFTLREGAARSSFTARTSGTGTSLLPTRVCTATSVSDCCGYASTSKRSGILANYTDGVSSLPLDALLADFSRKKAVATFLGAQRPDLSRGAGHADGTVTAMRAMHEQQLRINGGFFVMRSEIFNYIREGEELSSSHSPAHRREEARDVRLGRVLALHGHLQDKITFDRMEASGDCPWKVWLDQSDKDAVRS